MPGVRRFLERTWTILGVPTSDFPNVHADAALEMFTTFCALCGGVQTVARSGMVAEEGNVAEKP
jgi:hypothetical protein